MSNTSASAGWLTPLDAGPEYDTALLSLLCQWLAGVSGLPNNVVTTERPEDPQQTAARIEVQSILRDANPGFGHQSVSSTRLARHETLYCQLQFYGPQGQANACRFLDGIGVSQNQVELQRLGFSWVSQDPLVTLLDTTNTQPVKYHQVMLHLSRTVHREYSVMSLTQAPLFLTGESL